MWRKAMTRSLRRCASARIHSTHASHANRMVRADVLNRNAGRKRNVAMKKLCIAGAAYRIENANLSSRRRDLCMGKMYFGAPLGRQSLASHHSSN